MVKALEEAIEKIKKLPEDRRTFAAEILEQIAGAGSGIFVVPDDHRNLDDLRSYLLSRSPQATDGVRRDIDRAVQTLADFPRLGLPSSILVVRVLPSARYAFLIYHRIEGDEFVVVHVRDGRRAAPVAEDVRD